MNIFVRNIHRTPLNTKTIYMINILYILRYIFVYCGSGYFIVYQYAKESFWLVVVTNVLTKITSKYQRAKGMGFNVQLTALSDNFKV